MQESGVYILEAFEHFGIDTMTDPCLVGHSGAQFRCCQTCVVGHSCVTLELYWDLHWTGNYYPDKEISFTCTLSSSIVPGDPLEEQQYMPCRTLLSNMVPRTNSGSRASEVWVVQTKM